MKNTDTTVKKYRLFCKEATKGVEEKLRITELEISQKDLLLLLSKQDTMRKMFKEDGNIIVKGAVLAVVN